MVYRTYISYYKYNPIILPTPLFIRTGMFKLHMAHVDVHQGGSGEEVIGFRGNYYDSFVRKFPDVSCGRNTGNAITYDDYGIHFTILG